MVGQMLLFKFLLAISAIIFLVFVLHLCRRRSLKITSPIFECWSRLRYYLYRYGIRYQRIKPESPEARDETTKAKKSFFTNRLPKKIPPTSESQSESNRLLPLLGEYSGNVELASVPTNSDKEILPDLIGKSDILTEQGVIQIHTWLPSAFKYLSWRKLYSNIIDGNSFRTFYRATRKCGAHIVLIKTAEDYQFGAFIPHDVSPNMKKIPSIEIFVFRVSPPSVAGYYRWSGLNRNILCAKSKSYLLGSQPSILLFDGFQRGCSNPSDTFQSPRLSKLKTFDIRCIEIWQIKC